MGTWGSGIYENDGALDGLASLVWIPDDEQDPARVVAGIGLVAWLQPVTLSVAPGELRTAVERVAPGISDLPESTRHALAAVLADPETAAKRSTRTPAARAAIGHASCGPRIDALLDFPGAATVIAELAERAADRLDRALARPADLYEIAGDLGALGVLIELGEAGMWRAEPGRLADWRAGFDAADHRTTEERGFWDEYAARVRPGFALLTG